MEFDVDENLKNNILKSYLVKKSGGRFVSYLDELRRKVKKNA